MLWLACLHHVLDLLMEAAVVEKLGPTSGPREKYFAKFETYFNSLDEEEKAKIAAESTERIGLVSPEDDVTRQFHAEATAFFTEFLAQDNAFQRGDYQELARLITVRIACKK